MTSAAAYDKRIQNLGATYEQIPQYQLESSQDNITATAGGGKANAYQLTAMMSRVTVVATSGDSVMLPPSAPGLEVMVINKGANPLQVYGAGTDTINDVATGTGVSQMQNSVVIYSAASAGTWYTEGLASGFYGNFATSSAVNGIVAFAGGGQANATLLPAMINRVTTVATANDSVKLPPAIAGMSIVVSNAAASNSMNLFPNTGDNINTQGANTAFAVAAGKTVSLTSAVNGQWHAVLTA